jgi:hypothetical protein
MVLRYKPVTYDGKNTKISDEVHNRLVAESGAEKERKSANHVEAELVRYYNMMKIFKIGANRSTKITCIQN